MGRVVLATSRPGTYSPRWSSEKPSFCIRHSACFFHVFSKVNRGFHLTSKEENALFHQLSQHAALSAFVPVCTGYYQNVSSVSLSMATWPGLFFWMKAIMFARRTILALSSKFKGPWLLFIFLSPCADYNLRFFEK